jgi:peptidoglycan/LPS O-acetylase OafA/YrhL
MKLGYVPALDGLRGVAILLVVAYHFFGLQGGFFGVDVFFVLSGFLITTLLLEEHFDCGRISLRRFYARRARRLLPALGCVLMFSLLVAAANLQAGLTEFAWVRAKAVAACLFYAGNLVRAFGHQLPIELSPFWSLGQEEQFYIVWPALLIVVLRFRVRPARLAVALLSVGSLVIVWRIALLVSGASTDRVVFGPDAHSDGLLFGAALAAARFSGSLRIKRAAARSAAAGVAVVVILSVFVSGTRLGYMIGYPAIEVASVGLIVAAIAGSRLLSWRPLVWVGTISYGLYVWQGPVLLLFGHGVIAASIAVALGYGSTRWIEAPFRRRRATKAPTEGRLLVVEQDALGELDAAAAMQ